MRAVILFVICAVVCLAQRPEDQVLAVYRQMERAEQTGDVDAWVALWARESTANAEKIRPLWRARPEVHYTSSRIFVQGDEAVLLGAEDAAQFLRMRFVREDGRWKIRDAVFNDHAYHPDSVYAFVPPADGAFSRAGSPWGSAGAAFDAAGAAQHGWQVRAVSDESFLYIRIESAAAMPAPGSGAETPPMGWPVMKIAVAGVGEFVMHANANIGDQAQFGADGRATSHRHFVSYWLMVERGDRMIFQVSADSEGEALVRAGGHSFDVRIPLRTLGIVGGKAGKITVGDAAWPKAGLFRLDVAGYR